MKRIMANANDRNDVAEGCTVLATGRKLLSLSLSLNAIKKISGKDNGSRRCSRSGRLLTFPTGAVTSRILMALVMTAVLGVFASANTYADDSITLSIDTNTLELNLVPMSAAGNFAESAAANISVSTTSSSGYTLSIASSTGSTNLTSGGNTITSIGSNLTASDFSNSANTTYNNKWGYKPSQWVTTSGDTHSTTTNTGNNAVFKPLPNDAGEILAITDQANATGTHDTYTMSIGARVNSSTPIGSYSSDAFVIMAVTNFQGLTITYDGNGLYFDNDPSKTTNAVIYDATSNTSKQEVTKKSYVNGYKEDGSFSGYDTPAGNNVVTIDGASTIHIAVTYGAPQYNGGPPSDLYIWAGNHPDYTNTNSSTALSSCGSTSAVNGAYSSTGASGTQVTMECDITGDSVTFYDYSANTNNTASMGYYAVVTGEGDVTTYSKTTVSGTYATPADTPGSYTFFGWSTDPNATEPMYTNEADIIANAPYTNADITLNLYAVWGRTFDWVFARAGKTKYNGYYKMSDTTSAVCSDVYVGATEQVIDTRDGSIYTIGKLKDGKCWMLDNLAIDLTKALDSYSGADKITLDATNTNATNTSLGYLKGTTTRDPSTDASGKYATAAVANWTTSYSYSAPLVNMNSKATVPQGSDPMASTVSAGGWKIGGYYNYCAASAGSYCYGNGTSYGTSVGNATEDICPAGWRMPGGSTAIALGDNPPTGEYQNLYNQYKDYTNFRTALHLPLSGHFKNGSPDNRGFVGYWWSSTRIDSSNMYYLSAGTGNINSAYGYDLSGGLSIRCVLGP